MRWPAQSQPVRAIGSAKPRLHVDHSRHSFLSSSPHEVAVRPSRILSIALALLPFVATAPLAAQKPLISTAALITIVENHKGAVLRYIDAAPDSMLGYRPVKGVRTFAEQIEHAAGSNALIAHLAITGS